MFAAANANLIQVYSTFSFDNTANLKGHSGKVSYCMQWVAAGSERVGLVATPTLTPPLLINVFQNGGRLEACVSFSFFSLPGVKSEPPLRIQTKYENRKSYFYFNKP